LSLGGLRSLRFSPRAFGRFGFFLDGFNSLGPLLFLGA
jgi:hypothetical protein